MSVHLILGGARSGKSHYAETLANASALPVTYIATAQVYDDEFAKRVAMHQSSRPKDWTLIESPFNLADRIQEQVHPEKCVIVDCLTLWLAQLICPDCDQPAETDWQTEKAALLACLEKVSGRLILVSNEVGMGIVPMGALSRTFQDEQGRLNQAVAAIAEQVTFVAAGLPLSLKGSV